MDDNTFILLYRKSIDSRVFQNEGLWKIWTWCLMKASYKKRWVSVITGRGETEIEINPGQFIFGRKTAARELKMKSSTVNDRMKKLKNMQNIDIQPDTHYSIISIINWDVYQPKEIQTQQATRQASDNHPTGIRQASDTNNKVNKVNKEIYSRVVDYLNKKTNSDFKPTTKKTIELIDARTKEGFLPEDFKTVIDFKCKQWLSDGEKQEYLRPITLFSNKFEGYLNAAKREPLNGSQSHTEETPEDIQAEIDEALK